MNRSLTSLLMVGALATLLVALGIFQYRWLRQISESDLEKARARVQEQADRFAMDFNREIQNAYFNFQTDSESWRAKDWSAFTERYDFWREKTRYPNLISEIYFYEAKADAQMMRYDVGSKSFISTESPEDFTDIRSRSLNIKSFEPVNLKPLSLILPIHDTGRRVERIMIRSTDSNRVPEVSMPNRFGFLLIKLDPTTISDQILTYLTNKYFGDGEFRAGIRDRDGRPVFNAVSSDNGDASARLFDLSQDNFIFYANKDLVSSLDEGKGKGLIVNSRVESHTLSKTTVPGNTNRSVRIELKQDAGPRTSVFTATTNKATGESPWLLSVQHSAGSIDAFESATMLRNLAFGFGLLLLLLGAIATIVFSAYRAKELAQRQVDFVSSVSHEFRTPLAVISSAGENLADGVAKENEQVSRYGELIKDEGKKLSSMVEQILDFAGANVGRRHYSPERTSINEVINAAITDCSPLIERERVEVERHISDDLPLVDIDANAVGQAVHNLMVNAIKYGNGERWLRVVAENGDGTIRISVEDRGIGISKRDLKHVFEPFYRSKEAVDAQIHGNGLGLSIVKQIAEAHGGEVTAESDKGKGSRFTITLPV